MQQVTVERSVDFVEHATVKQLRNPLLEKC